VKRSDKIEKGENREVPFDLKIFEYLLNP